MMGKIFVTSMLAAFTGLMGPAAKEEPNRPPAPESGYEQLQGFQTVLVNQINKVLGTEKLPSAMGLPVEPGLYVTITPQRTVIFDKVGATIKDGRYADPTVAAECQAKCARSIFDAFFFNWRALAEESASLGIDVPSRVLFAADAQLPAKLLIETAYAAAETRPGMVPSLHLLLNGGMAGVRARPFSLVPPRGLQVGTGQRILGLTVKVEAGGRYRITAADPGFRRALDVDASTLKPTLVDLKKNYPSKMTVIIEAGDTATIADLVGLMVAAQEQFPRVVLSGGQVVRVG
jgi:hypothetical protein